MNEEPKTAYLTLRDGEKVECLVEETAPNTWQGVPHRDVHIDEVASAYIDVLPPGGEFSFVIQGVPE